MKNAEVRFICVIQDMTRPGGFKFKNVFMGIIRIKDESLFCFFSGHAQTQSTLHPTTQDKCIKPT